MCETESVVKTSKKPNADTSLSKRTGIFFTEGAASFCMNSHFAIAKLTFCQKMTCQNFTEISKPFRNQVLECLWDGGLSIETMLCFAEWPTSNQLRSTLNTNVITGLDMCKVCTEAVEVTTVLSP